MQIVFRSLITVIGLSFVLTACGEPADLSCNLTWNPTTSSEAITACLSHQCVDNEGCMLGVSCDDIAAEIGEIIGKPPVIKEVPSCLGELSATGEMYVLGVQGDHFVDCYGENPGGQAFCELYFDHSTID